MASLGYRLSDTATFPPPIHDCKAGVRFLRAGAEKWNLDPNRFGTWGARAGGHLAALLGTSDNAPELEEEIGTTGVPTSVRAVCDYYGPTDLLRLSSRSGPDSRLDHGAPGSPESQLLGGPLQSQIDLARLANPIRYVDAADPPFLIIHGDADPLVPHQQSALLHRAWRQAGVPSTLVIVPEGGHGPFRERTFLDRVARFSTGTSGR